MEWPIILGIVLGIHSQGQGRRGCSGRAAGVTIPVIILVVSAGSDPQVNPVATDVLPADQEGNLPSFGAGCGIAASPCYESTNG